MGVAILHESLDHSKVIGTLLIVGGILLAVVRGTVMKKRVFVYWDYSAGMLRTLYVRGLYRHITQTCYAACKARTSAQNRELIPIFLIITLLFN
ncbi:hypothetical protein LZ023_36470 (plasmid) [Pseudomonas silvicola]|nr:hypothetical protein LZ023_36470 [Pseudomonas silvicola]